VLLGVAVGLTVLALSLPDISTRAASLGQEGPADWQIGTGLIIAVGYVLLAATLVFAIAIDRRRARVARVVGWVGLVAWLILKVR
jgi:hypothetical protein